MKKILNIAGACILITGVLFVSSCENNIGDIEKDVFDSSSIYNDNAFDAIDNNITDNTSGENSEDNEDTSEINNESESQTTSDKISDTGYGEFIKPQ